MRRGKIEPPIHGNGVRGDLKIYHFIPVVQNLFAQDLPIVFLKKHHSHEEIRPFYETADLCLVTSLHDGMNLVAKEYVGARDDETGVLILSQFAGASRELRDALIVNPYDIEEMAEAIHVGLEMDPSDQKARMRRMRETLKNRNIYYWAADLIAALAQVRLEKPG